MADQRDFDADVNASSHACGRQHFALYGLIKGLRAGLSFLPENVLASCAACAAGNLNSPAPRLGPGIDARAMITTTLTQVPYLLRYRNLRTALPYIKASSALC